MTRDEYELVSLLGELRADGLIATGLIGWREPSTARLRSSANPDGPHQEWGTASRALLERVQAKGWIEMDRWPARIGHGQVIHLRDTPAGDAVTLAEMMAREHDVEGAGWWS